jgi:hypothetical protein
MRQFRVPVVKIVGILSLLVAVAVLSGFLSAQTKKTITIRILDSKTGNPITISEFQIFIKNPIRGTNEYIRSNRDGVRELDIKDETDVIRIYAPNPPWAYVSCDCVKDNPVVDSIYYSHWYSIAEILKAGIVAPNRCHRKKAVAKPGEIVFFVRPLTFLEKFHTDD